MNLNVELVQKVELDRPTMSAPARAAARTFPEEIAIRLVPGLVIA